MPKISKKTKSIQDIIQNYLDYCNYRNLSIKTVKSYYQTLSLFARYLEEEKSIIDIRKVNKEVVEEYITFMEERGKYSFVADDSHFKAVNIL